MPHHEENAGDTLPNRPVTRRKNATAHPGTDAQKVLSTRRDPEVIEKEKLERQAKKEARERQNAEEAARKEAAQQRIEQLRAQQATDLEEDKSEIPRQQPKAGNIKKVEGQGAVHGRGKAAEGSSSVAVKAANTATSAGSQGRKRKSVLTQQDDDKSQGCDEHPPAKKVKAPAAEQRTRPVPRPVQKKNTHHLEVVRGEEVMDPVSRRNTKKRPSEAADMAHGNDPKTPVSSKKAKIGLNEKSKDIVPIRRTETMIELVESKVVARRPTDIDLETASEEDGDDEQSPRAPTEDVDTDPYQTPVALTPANRKNKARVVGEPKDAAVESSDVEVITFEWMKDKRKQTALASAADKLSSTARDARDRSTQSIGNKSHNTSLSSPSRSSSAAKSLKSRTTALNEVAAARSSDGPTSKSKAATKTSKKPKIVENDEFKSLGEEDDTKEREAALSSPMKGKDSRQSTATKVKVEHGEEEEETLSANEKKKVKDDVIPHFMQKYTSEIDCFAPLTEKDFLLLEDLYHRVMGRPLPYKLTKNSEVVRMISAKLSDYRTQFRIQGDNSAKNLLNVYFDGAPDAIQDKQKRMEFGLYYCMEDEYKFQFKGSERPVGKFKASGRFLSKIFLDTFSIHYRYTLPKNPLPNWNTPIPVGGLALAAGAIDRALTLYRDDHYEYEKDTLSIKQPPVSQAAKEKAMKNRAARGGSEGDNDKAPSTSKFHFSKGKYGNIVLAWHGVLIQKAKANLPDICAQARKIFGATNVEIGNDSRRAQNVNPEVRTRVGLDSESESEEENSVNGGDDEDHARDRGEGDRNIDIDFHSSDGNDDDADNGHGNDHADDGNCHNGDQNGGGLSHFEEDGLEFNNRDADAEKDDGGKETEEIDPGPSHRRGRRGGRGGRHVTKARDHR